MTVFNYLGQTPAFLVGGYRFSLMAETLLTYPADKSREAIPTLSPRAWGTKEKRDNPAVMRAVIRKLESTTDNSCTKAAEY